MYQSGHPAKGGGGYEGVPDVEEGVHPDRHVTNLLIQSRIFSTAGLPEVSLLI